MIGVRGMKILNIDRMLYILFHINGQTKHKNTINNFYYHSYYCHKEFSLQFLLFSNKHVGNKIFSLLKSSPFFQPF